MAPKPGPFPPADFARRDLPVESVPTGSAFVRIHRTGAEALHFSMSGENRVDDPLGRYGVCYAARTLEGAFAETCLRQVGARLLAFSQTVARSVSVLTATAELRLAGLHGPGLAPTGATAAVSSGTYDLSQPWSRAIYDHPAEVDGIAYRSNHDNGEFCVALFERSRGRLRSGPAIELIHDRARLAALLDRYKVGLS